MKSFFQELSKRNNYADPEVTQKFYYGLMRLILDELKKNGEIELPDFGILSTTVWKERKIGLVNTSIAKVLPPTKVLHFRPCNKLREYIKNT